MRHGHITYTRRYTVDPCPRPSGHSGKGQNKLKSELEKEDKQEIAKEVVEMLIPFLSNIKQEGKDTIFDVAGLAGYLHIDKSWIYKQVSLRAIPFFKAGKYTRFRKSVIDRWIEKNMQSPLSTGRFNGRR